jgi:hypothetical protein
MTAEQYKSLAKTLAYRIMGKSPEITIPYDSRGITISDKEQTFWPRIEFSVSIKDETAKWREVCEKLAIIELDRADEANRQDSRSLLIFSDIPSVKEFNLVTNKGTTPKRVMPDGNYDEAVIIFEYKDKIILACKASFEDGKYVPPEGYIS